MEPLHAPRETLLAVAGKEKDVGLCVVDVF